jgi:ATP-dependent DNA helicase RecG
MTTNLTEELIRKRVSARLEFKPAAVDLRELGATVCAFLNSEGGNIIVGALGNGDVEPVGDAASKVKEIESFLSEAISPTALLSVQADATESGEVVVVEVAPGRDKPYVCSGAIHVRQGPRTVAADSATIRRMVHQQSGEPTRWERLACRVEMEDLDSQEILRTVDEARRNRNYTFDEPEDVFGVLTQLGLRRSGQLTNGADVLFAKNPSRRLPQTRIRATLFQTDKGGDFIDDRLFEGDALALVDQVHDFVVRNIQIRAEFREGQVQREDIPQYPLDALREGIINGIIHRDYSMFAGGMSVGIYPNRIEIWNTGRLPEGLKISDLKIQHPSLPANPDMAHVFYLRGTIERVGRGTLKIVEASKAAGLKVPQWKQSATGITLTFFAQRSQPRLNRRQKELLARLNPGDELKPADYYREMEGIVTPRQAQRDLANLRAGGWLQQEGDGPATIYTRTSLPGN